MELRIAGGGGHGISIVGVLSNCSSVVRLRLIQLDLPLTSNPDRLTPMKLGLINSAWVQANQPTVYGLRKTKELGFDTVDIFVDPLDIDIKERRLIKDECDRLELPIVSIACVAVGLIDFNPSVQRFHIERVKKYLDLAYEYEAKNVLLVLGEYIWNQEVIPPDEQWKTGVEELPAAGRLRGRAGRADRAGAGAVSSVARQLASIRWSASSTTATIRPCRPTSTSRTCCWRRSQPEELRRLKGKAIHVHISDCDGKKHGDLPPGRGVVPFEPYLREIKALDIDGAISIELEYSPEPDKITEWVAEAYHATDRLMQQAGLCG